MPVILMKGPVEPHSGGDGPYDLYATDTQSRGLIPFSYAWATEPQNITTFETVSDNASIAAAIAVSAWFLAAVSAFAVKRDAARAFWPMRRM